MRVQFQINVLFGILALIKAAPLCESDPPTLFIILDGSASIGISNFDKMLRLLSDFLKKFPTGTNVGVMQFGLTSRMEFGLLDYPGNPVAAADHVLHNIQYMNGRSTSTAGAITFATQELAKAPVSGILHVIVVTDGIAADWDSGKGEQKAAELKAIGSEMWALGITENINDTQLSQIASSPENIFKTENFNQLTKKFATEVFNKVCSKKVTTSMSSTASSTPTSGVSPPLHVAENCHDLVSHCEKFAVFCNRTVVNPTRSNDSREDKAHDDRKLFDTAIPKAFVDVDSVFENLLLKSIGSANNLLNNEEPDLQREDCAEMKCRLRLFGMLIESFCPSSCGLCEA